MWKCDAVKPLHTRIEAPSSRPAAAGLSFCVMLIAAYSSWGALLESVPDEQRRAVFCGIPQHVRVVLRNPGDQTVETDARCRLFQDGSATAAPVIDLPWKKLKLLPGQTVIESASLAFPNVKAETLFFVQWLDESNNVFGVTRFQVYPTNILAGLGVLIRHQPLGIWDPENHLKTLLSAAGVDFEDLGSRELDSFSGPLALLIQLNASGYPATGFAQRVKKLATRGAAVVWIRPLANPDNELRPAFYLVPVRAGTVLIAEPQLCVDLAERPHSQLNLISLAGLALHPKTPQLPQDSTNGDDL